MPDATQEHDADMIAAGPGLRARGPLQIPPRGWLAAVKRAIGRIGPHNVILMAGGVAFFVLLSVAPAMSAIASVYGLFTDPALAAEHAAAFEGVLPPEAFELFRGQLQRVSDMSETTLAVGLVVSVLFALWMASNGMRQFCFALTVVHDETKDRPFYLTALISVVLTIGAMVIFVLAGLIVTALPSVLDALFFDGGAELVYAAHWVALFALSAAFGSVIYRYGPDRAPPRWRWCWPGAVVAAALWVLMSLAFSFVMQSFGNVGEIYGPLAGVVLMMLWVELSTVIFLLGGELNQELERQTMEDTTVGPSLAMGRRGAVPADEVGPHPDVKALRRKAQAERFAEAPGE